jgi:hypothetical protein
VNAQVAIISTTESSSKSGLIPLKIKFQDGKGMLDLAKRLRRFSVAEGKEKLGWQDLKDGFSYGLFRHYTTAFVRG